MVRLWLWNDEPLTLCLIFIKIIFFFFYGNCYLSTQSVTLILFLVSYSAPDMNGVLKIFKPDGIRQQIIARCIRCSQYKGLPNDHTPPPDHDETKFEDSPPPPVHDEGNFVHVHGRIVKVKSKLFFLTENNYKMPTRTDSTATDYLLYVWMYELCLYCIRRRGNQTV